jgi:soluble lytic murein transglycosylase-like protein
MRMVRSDVQRAAERLVEVRRRAEGVPAAPPRRRGPVSLWAAGLAASALTGSLVVGALRYQSRPDLDAMEAAPAGTVEVVDEAFRMPANDRAALDPIIEEAAALYGVSADLVRAVIQTESRFDPTAVSPVGAKGLMQLMPKTARTLGVKDPFDPRDNIFGGVKYLSSLLERYDGNTALALAGYNAGPGNVRRHRGVPPFRETQGYVRKIAKLVADSDAAFTVPAPRKPKPRVRRAASRTKRSTAKSRAAVKRASLTRARAAAKKKATVRKASAKAPARKKATTRARARRRT